MRLTLAFLEPPMPTPSPPSRELRDAEARAEALNVLARLIAQTVSRPPRRRQLMSNITKINASHLSRAAYVYLRQSSPAQVGHNRESTQRQHTLDRCGARKKRVRKLPQSQWAVLIPNHHHQGFIDWSTYEANRIRITANTHPRRHQSGGGAVREGTALVKGLAVCGHCGRKLRTHYTGRTASPGYHCPGKRIENGRGLYCLNIGAIQFDDAVAQAVLTALAPLGIKAAIAAADRIEADHDGALAQWRLAVEPASYEAQRAERRYRSIDPDNRLVARGLEAEWESRCANWRPQKRNWRGANSSVPERSALTSEVVCSLSEPICASYGKRRPRRHATRKNCCAPCSKRSSLPSTRMNIART